MNQTFEPQRGLKTENNIISKDQFKNDKIWASESCIGRLENGLLRLVSEEQKLS